MKNTVFTLKQRPDGHINDGTFAMEEREAHEPRDGQVQVQTKFISLDPAMRPWVSDEPNYLPPVEIGAVMRGITIGTVTASKHPDFQVGEMVRGLMGVQTVYTGPPTNFNKVDPAHGPASNYLGILGGTGMAAYFGLLRTAELQDGETVLISAAAGAVGHIAVQIAKMKGCRVIGIAGGSEKCRRVTEEFGADHCIDYKNETVAARVRQLCPDQIDVYFDNVGGETLEAALDNIALGARIVVCGAIGQYDDMANVHGPRNYLNLIGKRAKMIGLLNFLFMEHYPEARAQLAKWEQEGHIVCQEQIEEGFERFPQVLQMLFAGKNTGKLILKV